jgi:hypothetical protein
MNSNAPLFADVERLSATSAAASRAGPRAIATCDHDVIRRWAARHQAEPATGSGPATAYAMWQARGCGHGHDDHDWFEAERQLASSGGRPMGGYHLMRAERSRSDG